MTRILLVLAALLALAGCSKAAVFEAQVKLKIDGTSHDFRTAQAQIDHSAGADRPSIYLLPETGQDTQSYLNLRQYQGNPVARFWLRHRPKDSSGDELPRFTCFVPGILADGRPTLGWKKDDGSARDRTETGDPDCQVQVERQGERLQLRFDALMQADKVRAAQGEQQDKPVAGHRIQGQAWLSLSGV